MADDKKGPEEDVQGLDDDGAEETLKLMSQENQPYVVTKKVAMMSELVKTMMEGGEWRATRTLRRAG
jgi:hypothetical protein